VLRQDGIFIWPLNHLYEEREQRYFEGHCTRSLFVNTFSFAEIGTFSPAGSATTPQLNVVLSPELVGTLFAKVHW
jgi:hypothetical protein